jgi:hypothetical protein
MEFQSKSTINLPSSSENDSIKKESGDIPSEPQSSIPILPPPSIDQQTGLYLLIYKQKKFISINYFRNTSRTKIID